MGRFWDSSATFVMIAALLAMVVVPAAFALQVGMHHLYQAETGEISWEPMTGLSNSADEALGIVFFGYALGAVVALFRVATGTSNMEHWAQCRPGVNSLLPPR
jgi:hypothetical protein